MRHGTGKDQHVEGERSETTNHTPRQGGVAMLTPVERNSLAAEVTKKLRTEILHGSIEPGARILEQEISGMLKTSRGPVRDALIRLEIEGLVTREPNRSATVVRMNAEDVEEVCSLRLTLELLALRYAIERAQADDIARLRQTLESYRAFLGESFSLEGAVDLDLSFHEEFVRASRHNRVLSMWQSIKPQIWFLIFSRNACDVETFRDSAMSHGILVDIMQKRDYESGKSFIQAHLDRAYADLIATYPRSREADGRPT